MSLLRQICILQGCRTWVIRQGGPPSLRGPGGCRRWLSVGAAVRSAVTSSSSPSSSSCRVCVAPGRGRRLRCRVVDVFPLEVVGLWCACGCARVVRFPFLADGLSLFPVSQLLVLLSCACPVVALSSYSRSPFVSSWRWRVRRRGLSTRARQLDARLGSRASSALGPRQMLRVHDRPGNLRKAPSEVAPSTHPNPVHLSSIRRMPLTNTRCTSYIIMLAIVICIHL